MGIREQQWFAVVGGITDDVDTPVRKRVGQHRCQLSGQAHRELVALPRHKRNRVGRHTGCEQNGSVTMIPARTHRLPRPSASGPCAELSWVQNAPNTFGPRRRNNVSSTQRILRLLVKDVLIGPDKITIRHRIPIREQATNNPHPTTDDADTENHPPAHYPLRWGRGFSRLGEPVHALRVRLVAGKGVPDSIIRTFR
jgi:hypothetical protein